MRLGSTIGPSEFRAGSANDRIYDLLMVLHIDMFTAKV